MSSSRSTYVSASGRPRRWAVAITVALLVGVAVVGALGYQVISTLSAAANGLPSADSRIAEETSPAGFSPGRKDGIVPDGTTVFDAQYPGIAYLDPELLAALRSAAERASAEGIEIQVNSGWRSKRYQKQLQRDAVAQYGSREAAARWVASPSRSAHVSGRAVDLGPFEASYWMEQHGAAFGLCRTYANESWHFELQPDAPRIGCARMYADPTEDPALLR